MAFAGGAADLTTGTNFSGKISGFAVGDAIVLDGMTATAATWSNGTLTLRDNASVVGSLALAGSYGTGNFAVSATGDDSQVIYLPGPANAVAEDFSGDGQSALLWQNTDGAPAIWLMDGLAPTATQQLANPGTAWHVVTSGDFTETASPTCSGRTMTAWSRSGTSTA